ncbi:DUF885 family protein [Ferruginibacter sp. HRS2-29]|uniref:DUF885 domain-containing protein n=1 Tax=Ferruginibacter sp. HRS2-29 TaxID=2487334 RepID=UPI0020CEAE72|nr:DUF885 domain-containing protein [Ferruginibacter sp. HRS2-29]MCP9750304.1 DUF885 domain-containing protein [Ferruginibacter sp. HRS2-29]
MKRLTLFSFLFLSLTACNQSKNQDTQNPAPDTAFASMLKNYYDERMALYPLEATMNGDTRFNNQLPADFTDSYRAKLKDFFTRYGAALKKFDRSKLNDNDAKSYDIFDYEMQTSLEGLTMHFMGSSMLNDNSYMPFDQFYGLTLSMGQMGSGTGNQPFKTVKDYDDWVQRASAFTAWADSAIVYLKKGMAADYTLPKALVVKMIPQMEAMVFTDPAKSIFYEPLRLMPASFSAEDKTRLTASFTDLINNKLVPAYKKLGAFLKNEYLPVARTSTGVNALPGGDAYYKYLVKYWTTTDKTPEDIYQTGLAEVKRIREEMENIKTQVKFNGDLKAFFEFMRTDKQFMPYKTAGEILDAFRKIQATIDPHLKKMFSLTPATKFEIRQTEAFRAASASAEYYPGLPDNSRPGIFYIPIIDPTKFNITSGMESLFLHEAIPGHHYQVSIQSENKQLPDFRKFIWYGAYGEGYALYCESLGKELGLYTNPYQHMGALGDEIHRAIRLVVDVAMHTGKMTREEAIKYMMDNEAISEDGATAEIERYMAIPGQALSYKTGALKIKELREKYSSLPGFTLSAFHTEYLKDGCMPLQIIEQSMDKWAKTLKK